MSDNSNTNKKKQILIIGPGMEIGGVERSLIGLLDSIDYDEYDVDLMLFEHSGEFMPLINSRVNLLEEIQDYALMNEGIKNLFATGKIRIGMIRAISKLYGDLRGLILHCGTVNTTLCRRLLTRKLEPSGRHYDLALGFFGPHYYLTSKVNADVKIGWVHTDYTAANEKQDTAFLGPMWDGPDYIACVSEDVRRSFNMVYPRLADKTIVIENILSHDFVRKQAEAFDVSKELGMSNSSNSDESQKHNSPTIILTVGRFSTPKNYLGIIRACRILADEGINFKWFFIGYGPDENKMGMLIKELGMEKHAVILGKKTNPYPYMKACNIYAQPSLYEGKAVTVREAQMLCKPVIITRYETSASQVEEGIDGYICEMSDRGIAEGIKRLIADGQLRNKLIQNCRYRSYSNVDEVEKIYEFMR